MAEKRAVTSRSRSRTPAYVSIIIGQHVLLWTSLYVAASTLYILVSEAVFTNDIPSVVLFLVASVVSLSYIILQNITTHLRKNARNRMQSETVDTCQCLATHTLRILCTIWMLAVALNITFTAARQALCAPGTSALRVLDKGNTCIINRVGILASCAALIACGILFMLMHKIDEPFRSHLFGLIPEDRLLPLFLPYRKSTHPMVSDMSFKCRSSTSLSSTTPTRPQGLGISATRASLPSLLRPRPSLCSIRTYTTTMSLPAPPTSPLPPLPTYFPERYRTRPIRPPRSDDSIRMILPPAPALSRQNVASLNRNNNPSLSSISIYSRTTSGESGTKPPSLSETGRTASSSSTVTLKHLKKSPLGEMTLVDEEIAVGTSRASFDSDIDDVAGLEARLVHARELMKSSVVEGCVERQSGLSRTFRYEVRKTGDYGPGYAF